MKLPAIVVALTALSAASAQGAEQIRVQSASNPAAMPSTSACVTTPAGDGSDIECTLNLSPAPGGPANPPTRIVIRPRWAPACVARDAQVVSLGARTPAAKDLPVVDQATTRSACAS